MKKIQKLLIFLLIVFSMSYAIIAKTKKNSQNSKIPSKLTKVYVLKNQIAPDLPPVCEIKLEVDENILNEDPQVISSLASSASMLKGSGFTYYLDKTKTPKEVVFILHEKAPAEILNREQKKNTKNCDPIKNASMQKIQISGKEYTNFDLAVAILTNAPPPLNLKASKPEDQEKFFNPDGETSPLSILPMRKKQITKKRPYILKNYLAPDLPPICEIELEVDENILNEDPKVIASLANSTSILQGQSFTYYLNAVKRPKEVNFVLYEKAPSELVTLYSDSSSEVEGSQETPKKPNTEKCAAIKKTSMEKIKIGEKEYTNLDLAVAILTYNPCCRE